ncbi:unnamed protein product [Gongylonema pulchrum]|uniref:NPL4 domain-containing protein n=1 Tax=Gongylonema pulchrum TaxID=637853 RepID=A0A183DFU1_9BILA|nr:unnamed protein product [Gongylonema pulchrum]
MIGRYELFPEVPLGIKATVAAIYEPPQSSSADSLTLEDDPQEELVDELCSFLGLKRVAMAISVPNLPQLWHQVQFLTL